LTKNGCSWSWDKRRDCRNSLRNSEVERSLEDSCLRNSLRLKCRLDTWSNSNDAERDLPASSVVPRASSRLREPLRGEIRWRPRRGSHANFDGWIATFVEVAEKFKVDPPNELEILRETFRS
jgi:hypothetical protein